MKRSIIIQAFLLMSSLALSAQSASVSSTYVEVSEDWKTLEVHTKFNVHGMSGKEGKVIVYFYDENGNGLKDWDGSYKTIDGKVSASKKITPRYDNSLYKDFTVSIPTSQLHLNGFGKKVYYKISIWNPEKRHLCLSGPYFALTASAPENDGEWSSYTLGNLCHTKAKCQVCGQTGKCGYCGGAGQVFAFMGYIPCSFCAMTGVCSLCYGKGYMESQAFVGASSVPAVPPAGGTYTGGSVYNSGSSFQSSSGSGSTRRTCPGCNGTGKGMSRIEYAPNYTGQDNSVYCAECGRVMSAHTHIHETCRVCYGKGYVD